MVTKHEAVCLWEDNVGDSGRAPTDLELHTFALAVEEKARKPFEKLHKQWKRAAKSNRAEARNNFWSPSYKKLYEDSARELELYAKHLKNRLDAKN